MDESKKTTSFEDASLVLWNIVSTAPGATPGSLTLSGDAPAIEPIIVLGDVLVVPGSPASGAMSPGNSEAVGNHICKAYQAQVQSTKIISVLE